MTIVLPARAERRDFGFDISKPVLLVFAAILFALIVMPVSWLVFYAFSDKDGAFTVDNFHRLVADAAYLNPLLTTFALATLSALICCAVAAPMGWLVARTDMPLRRTVRLLVTASFVTPPFLGAIAWELLAAPNSGLLNQLYREVTGAQSDFHLFNIYSFSGLVFVISCYTFPYVFVLVANALDRTPGDLEDASAILGGKAWDIGAAHHHPAGAAGGVGRGAGCVFAGHDAVRLAGDSGDARRLPHHDHQDLESVPVSA